MKKRLISLLLAVGMILSLFPVSAFAEEAAEPTTKEVSTVEELESAIDAINKADSGVFVIKLNANIDLQSDADITLNRNTTTLLGGGYSLRGGGSQTLSVKGSAVLNLGGQDGTDVLTFDGNNQDITAVSVSGKAQLNMYDGVTIENYTDSGVQVGAGAGFEMHGGTIQNCSANQNGGGVAVSGERNGNTQAVTLATFTMSGGTIKNCTAVDEGGGVTADYANITLSGGSIENCSASKGGGINFEDGKFTMSGGTISGCEASSKDTGGGGIAITNSAGDIDLEFTGGSITNNRADSGNGGGIYVISMGNFEAVKSVTITGNHAAVNGGGIYIIASQSLDMSSTTNILCNNTADTEGADIYICDGSIKLPAAASMNQNYGTTGHKIDGWYLDNTTERYTPNEYGKAQDVTAAVSGPRGLTASYKRARYAVKVTAPDSSYGAEAKVGGSKVESALEDEPVYLSYDDTALKEGETFEKWTVTAANGKSVEVKQDTDGAYYFVMPGSDVTVVLGICPAGAEPDTPVEPSESADPVGSIAIGAMVGAAGYYVGTGLYLDTIFGYVPANRQALASALWEKADKPEPQSTALYTDVDEKNADAQKADRWCVEQGLLPDRGEDTFKPAGWVTHTRCIVSWKKLEKMLKNTAE